MKHTHMLVVRNRKEHLHYLLLDIINFIFNSKNSNFFIKVKNNIFDKDFGLLDIVFISNKKE